MALNVLNVQMAAVNAAVPQAALLVQQDTTNDLILHFVILAFLDVQFALDQLDVPAVFPATLK